MALSLLNQEMIQEEDLFLLECHLDLRKAACHFYQIYSHLYLQ